MFDDQDLDAIVKESIYGLLLNLYDYGMDEVHLGGMLRILGVANDIAARYDEDIVILDDNFAKYVRDLTNNKNDSAGQTLH
jgi:hypothetical protein